MQIIITYFKCHSSAILSALKSETTNNNKISIPINISNYNIRDRYSLFAKQTVFNQYQ